MVTQNGINNQITNNDFTVVHDDSAGNAQIALSNTSNTAGSNAAVLVTVAGSSAGDAFTQYSVFANQAWAIGVDNSDSDSMVIAASSTLGTNNALRMTPAGSTTATIQSGQTYAIVGNGGTINVGTDATTNTFNVGSSSALSSSISVGDHTLSVNAGATGGGAILITAGVGGTGGTIQIYTNSLGGVGINSSPINGGSTNIGSSTSSSTSIGCSSSSSISLNPNGGTVNIGNTGVNTIVIGNASNANISITSNTSVTIANGSSAGFIIMNGAGGNIAIGTDNFPNTITIGSTNTTASTIIQAGSGGITLSGRTAYMPIVGGTTTTAPIQSVSTAGATAGMVLTYVSSSAIPTWQAATGGFTWQDKATAFNAVAANGYFVTGTTTATLPASPNEGDTISFIVDDTLITTILANSGQKIRIGSFLSGSAGNAVNTARGDSITLVYRTTGTTWMSLTGPQGTWTVT